MPKRLNAIGVRIAIDDFGTGYSVLALGHSLGLQVVSEGVQTQNQQICMQLPG